jgi:uncharacterized protein involved in outer membrane biogenesis
VKFLRSKRGLAVIAALLLVMFLWRPGVYRLRNRISSSIGNALGRRVTINNVQLRILPRPGFDLEGLVIYDDPAFSPEPMIRADEVSAAIRLRSLLRGRLEIANLSATEPSVNLVRNDQGLWNLASLLARNAQIPAAPTAKPAFERRPAFPYLEATGARVNFKIGQTKKSYALTDADVALWQDSDNSWGARLKAEPVRTDFNLTDTGLLQINASWQRAPSPLTTPIQIAVQWKNGQLGQITKLLNGKDRGWRGGLTFTAKLSGTPEALQIQSQASIDNFHRYDITDPASLRLAANCSGEYNSPTGTLANLLCESPVSDGTLRLHGTLRLVAAPDYDLTVQAERVPVETLVLLLRQAKKQIPPDLTATGLLNAAFHFENSAATSEEKLYRRSLPQTHPQWTGTGSATNVRLSSNTGKDDVAIGPIPLTLISGTAPISTKSASPTPSHALAQLPKSELEPSSPHLRIGPVTLAINGALPVNAGGWVSSTGYRFFLRGDLQLQDLFRLENVLALPAARPAAEGATKLDVSVSGPWLGFAPPTTLGTAQLRNVHAEMRGFNTPIEIASANVSLTPDAVLLQKLVAHTGDVHWTGTVTAPRHCAAAATLPGDSASPGSAIPAAGPVCNFQFDLAADRLSTGDLADWFIPHRAKRPWYRLLTPETSPGISPLLGIQARGNLRVGSFALKTIAASQVSSQVAIARGKITLNNLRAQLLQGTHQGNWIIDASNDDASNPRLHYQATGTFHDIALQHVAALMNDPWITGTADATFDLDGSANTFSEVPAHSDAKLQFVMRNGSLPHIAIPGTHAPLAVHRFVGTLGLKKGAWDLAHGQLETRDTSYRVSGTASPEGEVDFALRSSKDQAWTLTGTLAKPHIANPEASDHPEANAKVVNQ